MQVTWFRAWRWGHWAPVGTSGRTGLWGDSQVSLFPHDTSLEGLPHACGQLAEAQALA